LTNKQLKTLIVAHNVSHTSGRIPKTALPPGDKLYFNLFVYEQTRSP